MCRLLLSLLAYESTTKFDILTDSGNVGAGAAVGMNEAKKCEGCNEENGGIN